MYVAQPRLAPSKSAFSSRRFRIISFLPLYLRWSLHRKSIARPHTNFGIASFCLAWTVCIENDRRENDCSFCVNASRKVMPKLVWGHALCIQDIWELSRILLDDDGGPRRIFRHRITKPKTQERHRDDDKENNYLPLVFFPEIHDLDQE